MNYDHWRHYARGWLLHFIGKTDAAYDAYLVAFRHNPKDVQAARHLGSIAAQRADHVAAEKWLMEVARLAPEDADNHFNVGFVREQMNATRPAIESFKEAVRLRPILDRAWYGMGLAHAKLGEHADAAAAFREAARLQPMNGHAWYQLGMAYHHCGESERLEQVLHKLLKFDPKISRQLIEDSGRLDLLPLLPELPW